MVVDEDGPVNINLSGILGETLLLALDPLPKGKRFPGLEFYTSHSRYITWTVAQVQLRFTRPIIYRLASTLADHWSCGRDLAVS